MQDSKLDDTQEMPAIGAAFGSPAISPWDDDMSSLRLVPKVSAHVLTPVDFGRIQERSVAAMADAWGVARQYADEPAPYLLTDLAEQLFATAGR